MDTIGSNLSPQEILAAARSTFGQTCTFGLEHRDSHWWITVTALSTSPDPKLYKVTWTDEGVVFN